jgi:hypothetical protein
MIERRPLWVVEAIAGACLAAIAALAALANFAGAAAAEPLDAFSHRLAPPRWSAAEPDTALERFFGGLTDSTDRYFQKATAPVDTTGLDSARAAGLMPSSKSSKRQRRLSLDWGPVLRFNRVDAGVYGLTAGYDRGLLGNRLRGRLEYVAGPNLWQGGASWRARRGSLERGWVLDSWVGRETSVMDRIITTSVDDVLGTAGALALGRDTRLFLRQDGWRASLTRITERWRLTFGWRDMLESPLGVTAGWNLFHNELQVPDNAQAWLGRAHEALWRAAARVPGTPIEVDGEYRVSRRALGSDFEYRLARAAAGANVGVGSWVAVVPQVLYGRGSLDIPPQECFNLGQTTALTTTAGESVAGSSVALGRLDLIGTRDVLALAHLPHPAMLPLQLAVFAASGAVWGTDPFGGPVRPGTDWPEQNLWRSEAGGALVWQPGLPDPLSMARLSVSWPIGPGSHETHYTLTFTQALSLLERRSH